MTTWFTSDLHLGHEKIAALRGFDTVIAHDQTVMHNWRARIRDDDTVFVLGDIATRNHAIALMRIALLPGEKHLIAGNHDPVHPMHRTARNAFTDPLWWQAFATIQPFGHVRAMRQKVLLSHFPYAADRGATRYPEWRLPDCGLPLLHGHTHETTRHYSDHEMHVGLDAWNLCPVSIGEVDKWLAGKVN